MRTPSNAAGAHGLSVVLLLAVILFVGLALVPRAFEFRAWPQPARQDVAEEVVARSAAAATEVPVVRVRSAKRPGRSDALAVRGRKSRRRGSDGGALAVRSDRGSQASRVEAPSDGGTPGQGAGVPPVVVVEETPAPQPLAPVDEPDRSAQLAEIPEPDLVLRAGADRYAPQSESESESESRAQPEPDEGSGLDAEAESFSPHYEPYRPGRHGRHGRR